MPRLDACPPFAREGPPCSDRCSQPFAPEKSLHRAACARVQTNVASFEIRAHMRSSRSASMASMDARTIGARGMAPCARGSHSTRKRRGPIRPGMRPCESGLDRVRFRGSAARPLLRRSRERRGRHAWACSPLREERCRHPHSLRLSHGICKWHKQAAAAPWHSNRSATARRHATWLNSVMRVTARCLTVYAREIAA